MRREWGGCAGNIAYNLKALGGEPVVMATVGDDGEATVERLRGAERCDGRRARRSGTYTAQAFIITDLDDNQITAFHPGRDERVAPQSRRRRCATSRSASSRRTAREGMREHVRDFAAAGVPLHFRSGPGVCRCSPAPS